MLSLKANIFFDHFLQQFISVSVNGFITENHEY